MASSRQLVLLTVACSLDGVSSSSNGNGSPCWSRLSVPKPSLIVRTESNVWREERKKPSPPCVVCKGSGRVDCRYCRGRGRTNCVNLAMLPKGEWPKWCRTCGGSGLDYCNRCLGTGEYRDVMGFHFMKMGTNTARRQQGNEAPE